MCIPVSEARVQRSIAGACPRVLLPASPRAEHLEEQVGADRAGVRPSAPCPSLQEGGQSCHLGHSDAEELVGVLNTHPGNTDTEIKCVHVNIGVDGFPLPL